MLVDEKGAKEMNEEARMRCSVSLNRQQKNFGGGISGLGEVDEGLREEKTRMHLRFLGGRNVPEMENEENTYQNQCTELFAHR